MKDTHFSYTQVFSNVNESISCLVDKLEALDIFLSHIVEEAGYDDSINHGIRAIFGDVRNHAKSLERYLITVSKIK